MLTARQQALLAYVHERVSSTGVAPSFEEMKQALDLRSKSGVHRLISALEERGFLRRLPNRARALEVTRLPGAAAWPGVVGASAAPGVEDELAEARRRRGRGAAPAHRELLLVGRIAAGQPIEALEDPEPLVVPAALLGAGEHYALEVRGDSMVDAGILDGDYALIRRTDEARDGDVVVALIDNSEATLKYLHRANGMVRLDPANPRHQPQEYLPSRVRIQGRLAGLLRRY